MLFSSHNIPTSHSSVPSTTLKVLVFVAVALLSLLLFPTPDNAFPDHDGEGTSWTYETLTAEWDGKKGAAGKKTVLHLIQVRKTVFLLLFENITPDNAVYTEPIIFAASVSV